ncbi:TPA: hypothetical protein CPT87_01840 [Candidatus Gastranaerophilales bacterium HUM_5]|nr:MAG TPA: hypothetical protein CPT99_05790 [Candidatus Gastranaerophilales bacterium HUM_4]DAA92475.1 MAG TPA: hypothetical protein CPT87_01840 [Candidatus Gastranaerophilales bacterium HUM_5]DAB12244.1 MAG TPA: hypothetical protein CPT91_03510 [Candidatus Gastranaerophilales bacterium HUM_16]
MKKLAGYKEEIHSCSKCGLCQSVCPIYKITGNDCTVSRGLFIMLKGLIKGELKMSKKLNRYLDLCLKCGACTKFCPSGIDAVEIITAAKAEYFKKHPFEKVISFVQKRLIFGLGVNLMGMFTKNIKGKTFDKKVIYFGGCGGEVKGNKSVVTLLNACGIEVITPHFKCCGIPLYVRGDIDSYLSYKESFIKIIEKYDIKDIVTTCASCEKTIKGYNIEGLNVKNIFEYIKENELKISLKKPVKVTFHKPCNIDNFQDIKWILNNTKNLEYVEMENFDSCCGLNGISKLNEYGIMYKIFKNKHNNIVKTGTKTVLTSCIGCEIALNLFSAGKYRVFDFTDFIAASTK